MKRTGSMGSRVPPAETTTCAAGQVVGPAHPRGGPGRAGRRRTARPDRAAAPCRSRRRSDGRRGLDDETAAGPERRDVGLGGGVLPHLGVHRGREHDRAPCGERACWSAGRRRGRERPWPAGPRSPVPRGPGRPPWPSRTCGTSWTCSNTSVGDGLAGQRRPRGRADEAQRVSGRDHADPVARFGEPAEQLAGLVGGDAAADTEKDSGPSPAAGSRTLWASSAVRVTEPSGFDGLEG